MKTCNPRKRRNAHPRGSVLAFVLVLTVILAMIGFALMKVSEGAVVQAVLFQNEQVAMLAAEAAYENAIYWMSQNPDLLLDIDMDGTTGSLDFPNSRADYQVRFFDFVGYRPVWEITADGYCGTFHRSIRVYAAQAVSGWEMGMCRIPAGTVSTDEVNFADGEVIDMPIHINSYADPQDSQRDIFISGDPAFLQEVCMEEARHSAGGYDKYRTVMDVFDNGILFEQPRSLISDEESVEKKIEWYKRTISDKRPDLIFKPDSEDDVPRDLPAVQLEFFVGANGKGYVRITDDCTVRGYETDDDTWDYKVRPNTDGTRFEQYPIYAFHCIPEDAEEDGKRYVVPIDGIQVTANYGSVESPPCGMIYVDGNVIIGSKSENTANPQVAALNVVQGKVSVIATGNIWLTNSVTVSDRDDFGNTYPRQDNGMPGLDNPNALGLFAGGVIKVVDPGLAADFSVGGYWQRVGWFSWEWVGGHMPEYDDVEYEPIGIRDSSGEEFDRHLPDPMVVEAALTVGGGGWGAENVRRNYNGGRKETSGVQDDLLVRGTISEVLRGVVGVIGSDGFLKQYYFDRRLVSGMIPGNVRLKGKFATVPGGWSDYRVDPKPED